MMQFNNVAQFVANNINQHGFVLNNNLTAVEPVLVDHIYDSHGSTGPLVLVGFLAGEPIYRTTHTVAHHMEGNEPGDYQIYWPPLFPNIWIPECDLMQLDISIRAVVRFFFKIYSLTGRPIKDFSNYEDEDDVLFLFHLTFFVFEHETNSNEARAFNRNVHSIPKSSTNNSLSFLRSSFGQRLKNKGTFHIVTGMTRLNETSFHNVEQD